MNNIKAIFMDLDGTVLTSEHKVSENLIKKIERIGRKWSENIYCNWENLYFIKALCGNARYKKSSN